MATFFSKERFHGTINFAMESRDAIVYRTLMDSILIFEAFKDGILFLVGIFFCYQNSMCKTVNSN